jgi:hypothetical protein
MHRPSILAEAFDNVDPRRVARSLSPRLLQETGQRVSHQLSSTLLASQPTSSQGLLFRHAVLQIPDLDTDHIPYYR